MLKERGRLLSEIHATIPRKDNHRGRLLSKIHATIPRKDNQSPIYKSPTLGSNELVGQHQSRFSIKGVRILSMSPAYIHWAKIGARLTLFSRIVMMGCLFDHTHCIQ